MIELLTLVFLSSLAEEAKANAFEEKSATIRAQHVRAVAKVCGKTTHMFPLRLTCVDIILKCHLNRAVDC
ncbi:hypothetical protein F2P81_023942 [Scophthalmus maximus]|uniref:Centromere protein W n=1 Tax=Scophthalmus maximus TaxID=52904 RepID=A0A6A4RW38_SCOMX|nr:hypothetical protein F2P81_023942 [Scophthalmus maximus]